MSWNADRVSEHDPGEHPTRLACSRDCRVLPRHRLHVCGQISPFSVPLSSAPVRRFLPNEWMAVARRLQPPRLCAHRGTAYDISDVVVPT